MGQLWQDSLESIDGTGLFGQYHWDKAAETTKNGQDGLTDHLGQYREDGNARKTYEKNKDKVNIFTKIGLENHQLFDNFYNFAKF
jgi:hypothetical protein